MIYLLNIPTKSVNDRVFAREYNDIIDTINALAAYYNISYLSLDYKQPGDFVHGPYLNTLRDKINDIIDEIGDPAITELILSDKLDGQTYTHVEFNALVAKINEVVNYTNNTTPPVTGDYFMLEDGSGLFLLENDNGFILLEN